MNFILKKERTFENAFIIGGLLIPAAIGFVYTILNLHRMKGDGISYLDLADSYLGLDYNAMANSTWSPLYPFLLAIIKGIFQPAQSNNFLFVQIVNLLIFIATLLSFYWLFTLLSKRVVDRFALTSGYLISLSLFSYCSLSLVVSTSATPDMLLFLILILLTGTVVRRIDDRDGKKAVWIGLLCGIGFLCKAILFIISPLILICSFLLLYRHNTWRRTAIPIIGFLLVVIPWIFFLSFSKGRITYSDIGWINYCIDVGPCENSHNNYYEQMDPKSKLVIYNTQHTNVTYPPWFDISESWVGAETAFSLSHQLNALQRNSLHAFKFLFTIFTIPFFLSFFFFVITMYAITTEIVKTYWILLVVAASGGIYFLSHVEERYLGPFLFVFFVPFIIAYMKMMSIERHGLLKRLLVLPALLLFCAPLYPLIKGWSKMISESKDNYNAVLTAESAGLGTSDRVVLMGNGLDLFWPKLVGTRVIGEFKDEKLFSGLTDPERRALECKLKDFEIDAIVTTKVPEVRAMDWKEIIPNKSYAYLVRCDEE